MNIIGAIMANEAEKSLIALLVDHMIDLKVELKEVNRSTSKIDDLAKSFEALEKKIDNLETTINDLKEENLELKDIILENLEEEEDLPEEKTTAEKFQDRFFTLVETNPEAAEKLITSLNIDMSFFGDMFRKSE